MNSYDTKTWAWEAQVNALKSELEAQAAENRSLQAGMMQMAEAMATQVATIERLRAALEDIASGKYSGVALTSHPPQDPAVNRARAALRGDA